MLAASQPLKPGPGLCTHFVPNHEHFIYSHNIRIGAVLSMTLLSTLGSGPVETRTACSDGAAKESAVSMPRCQLIRNLPTSSHLLAYYTVIGGKTNTYRRGDLITEADCGPRESSGRHR